MSTPGNELAALADRLQEYRVWNARSNRYDAVPLILDAAKALRSAATRPDAGAVKEACKRVVQHSIAGTSRMLNLSKNDPALSDTGLAAIKDRAEASIMTAQSIAAAIDALELPAKAAGGVREAQFLPVDDDSRGHCDSSLPSDMIVAGSEALEKCQNDLRDYISGETIDWDNGMIAVAVYRAMTKAALAREEIGAAVPLGATAATPGEIAAAKKLIGPGPSEPSAPSKRDEPVLTDSALRQMWRNAGGGFHGPHIETGTMPEEQLLPFLRSLAQPRTVDAEAIKAVADRIVVDAISRSAVGDNLTTISDDAASAIAQLIAEKR